MNGGSGGGRGPRCCLGGNTRGIFVFTWGRGWLLPNVTGEGQKKKTRNAGKGQATDIGVCDHRTSIHGTST